jgi:ABC-type dipeptide/oligopeptide/nickel transport system permease component
VAVGGLGSAGGSVRKYVLVRGLYSLVTLWLLITIIFVMVRLTGDPVAMKGEVGADAAYLEQVRRNWGLDKPFYYQYAGFIGNLLRGDFGHSFEKSLPVRDIYFERLPNSLKLGFAAFVISIVLGVPLGMLSALRVNTWWDSAGKLIALVGLSMPGFFVGMVLIIVFGVGLGWLPVLGKGPSAFVWSNPMTWVPFWFRDWGHLIMPAFALGWYFSGAMLRITRSGMLDVLGSDYIKLVRLKGVPERMVVAKHAFKNSMIPVLTFAGLNLLIMVNVAVVIEVIFNWPGVGQLLYDGLSNRDFPMVQGVVLMSGLMIVVLNFVIDVLYGYVDPRIRLSR